METTFDRSKFFRPTEKYLNMFRRNGEDEGENLKNWFNLDMIHWCKMRNNPSYQPGEFEVAYKSFTDYYGVEVTIDELVETFSDYPDEDWAGLVAATAGAMRDNVDL